MSGGIGATAEDTPRRRSLSFRHLNALALSIILAASGMVSAFDIATALLSFPYILFLSRFAFPLLRPSRPAEPLVLDFGNRRLLAVHTTIAALLGLLLPIAYILEGVIEGDKEGIKAAAPHLFLVASQVFMEGVTFSEHFSLPIWAFVPVSFNALRMSTLIDWVMGEMGKEAAAGGERGSALRLLAGRGLAVANLVFWAFNLFGFLLPVFLPWALKRHYGYKAE